MNLQEGAEAVGVFADTAVADLDGVGKGLVAAVQACLDATSDLSPSDPLRQELIASAASAKAATVAFSDWLVQHRSDPDVFLQAYSGIGEEAYVWFLQHVNPSTPPDIPVDCVYLHEPYTTNLRWYFFRFLLFTTSALQVSSQSGPD